MVETPKFNTQAPQSRGREAFSCSQQNGRFGFGQGIITASAMFADWFTDRLFGFSALPVALAGWHMLNAEDDNQRREAQAQAVLDTAPVERMSCFPLLMAAIVALTVWIAYAKFAAVARRVGPIAMLIAAKLAACPALAPMGPNRRFE